MGKRKQRKTIEERKNKHKNVFDNQENQQHKGNYQSPAKADNNHGNRGYETADRGKY